MAPQELDFAARAARATAFYLSNIFFAVNAANYFASDVQSNPLLHTWSLAVEEQFYLIWPLVIGAAIHFLKSVSRLRLVLACLTIGSFAVSALLTDSQGPLAFYGLHTRAWEFGLGGLAALIPVDGQSKPPISYAIGTTSGLAMLAVSAFTITSETTFPGWAAFAPTFATAIVLASFNTSGTKIKTSILDLSALQFIGSRSYSWYLWHWPFLVLAKAIWPTIGTYGKCAASLCALAVANVAFLYFERPIRFNAALSNRRAMTYALGGLLLIVALTLAAATARYAQHLAQSPEVKAISAAAEDVALLSRETCVTDRQGSTPSICRFGASASSVNVVLFGDSHALQWFNGIAAVAERRRWSLATVLKSGCPAADISPPFTGVVAARNCMTWRKLAIDEIVRLHPNLILVGNSTIYLSQNDHGVKSSVSLGDWRAGSRATIQELAASGAAIIVFRDVPIPGFSIPDCMARAQRLSWLTTRNCSFRRSSAVSDVVYAAERDAAIGIPKVTSIDMTDSICGSDLCFSVRDGIIVYRDSNHITGRFATEQADELESMMIASLSAARK